MCTTKSFLLKSAACNRQRRSVIYFPNSNNKCWVHLGRESLKHFERQFQPALFSLIHFRALQTTYKNTIHIQYVIYIPTSNEKS